MNRVNDALREAPAVESHGVPESTADGIRRRLLNEVTLERLVFNGETTFARRGSY